MEKLHDLEILIERGHRLIVVETEREGCFIEGFRRIAKRAQRAYFQWTVTQGLLRLSEGYSTQAINKDLAQLFAQIQGTQAQSVYILVDVHPYLQDPVTVRHIKDVLLSSPQHCLILLAQKIRLPEELNSLATHFELPLPTEKQLTRMVNDLAVEYLAQSSQRLKAQEKGVIARLVRALCGVPLGEAERMAKHAIFDDGVIDEEDIVSVTQKKFDVLNSDNVLNLYLDHEQLEDIAGFENLKRWLSLRGRVFKGEKKGQENLPTVDRPKGCLLLGVQGCGKSMAAKAVAGSWQLPLLHLDFGVLYNRWMGQTEDNLRSALDMAERMAPCVLWIDEIEKGLSAVSSSDDVSKRLLATFLTWLAENEAAVFVVATANDVSALPPELMRKGRFDEVFFVDLPTANVRAEILRVHLERRKLPLENVDLAALAAMTEGFSGAELEQVVVSAMYQSYEDNEDITGESLAAQIQATRPLSVLMHEKVSALRIWAKDRAVSV